MSFKSISTLVLIVVCVVKGVNAFDNGEIFEPICALIMIALVNLDSRVETSKES